MREKMTHKFVVSEKNSTFASLFVAKTILMGLLFGRKALIQKFRFKVKNCC